MHKQVHRLGFYATPEHPCSYLPDKQATTLFADPGYPMTREVYTQLAAKGFRRSGEFLYQPWCKGCHACVPVRVNVQNFTMRRTQQRIWRRNQEMKVTPQPAAFNAAHYELYQRYINTRHPGGGMENSSPRDYLGFLNSSWMDTIFYEFSLQDILVAVAVVDELEDSLSAVYTFFDPDYSPRSPGVYAVLYQIMEARRRGLQWVYLGYWIAACDKMNYKNQYQPLEYLHNQHWTAVQP